jgi:MFS family permease
MHGGEHFDKPALKSEKPWYAEMTRYHWFVLFVAALGWLFDCLDQQLFILARPKAMEDLVKVAPEGKSLADARSSAGNFATSIFMFGWATGGLFFGILGDRIGRAKTMIITILLYSLFTGLSALSVGVLDFAAYRFLTGLGVGGEFAVGIALVAEVMPDSARARTLSLLQALSAVGNVSAALINLGMGIAEEEGLVESPWRIMFMIGAVPALLALVIRAKLKEPEKWTQMKKESLARKQLGSYRELFGDPVLRKHALLGLVLGCSGIVGLWSVGFFTPDLIRIVQMKTMRATVIGEHVADAKNDAAVIARIDAVRASYDVPKGTEPPVLSADGIELKAKIDKTTSGRLSRWSSYTSIAINIGAFCGMFGFGALAQRIGRKPTFAIAFVAAFVSTAAVFWFLQDMWQVWVMVPVMGFCQLSLFAGYAIYFPELFPTRLRSTGTSFCYNVGRFVAAFGPLVKTALEGAFSSITDHPTDKLRYAGVTMCFVFLVGLLVLPFLPETKGKPLPE